MKIVFFGTGSFGLPCLEALQSRYDLAAVVTSPDKPKGRYLTPRSSPVKEWALEARKTLIEYSKENFTGITRFLRESRPDFFVAVSFGFILPKELLEIPRAMSLNVHSSLLPRHRGAAPIQWAILSGDQETGVTLMRISEKLDGGDTLLQKKVKIQAEDDAVTLERKLSLLGSDVLNEGLRMIEKGNAKWTPQDERLATYARKIIKEDGSIDWKKPADAILRQIRAMAGWPRAYSFINGKRMIFLRAGETNFKAEGERKPGEAITKDQGGLFVVAGDHSMLEIKELQIEGKRPLSAQKFLRGFSIKPGNVFG